MVNPAAYVHPMYMARRGIQPKRPKFSRHFLKEWRDKRGLTQERLGELVDRSHASIQRMEARQQAITQPVLDDLAVALKTTRGAILDRPPSDNE